MDILLTNSTNSPAGTNQIRMCYIVSLKNKTLCTKPHRKNIKVKAEKKKKKKKKTFQLYVYLVGENSETINRDGEINKKIVTFFIV